MRKIILLISFCFVFTLAACGRGNRTTDEDNNYLDQHANPNSQARHSAGVPPGGQPVVQTLTVLAPYCIFIGTHETTFNWAELRMQQARQHKDETFNLEVEWVRWDDWHGTEQRNQRLYMQMMAGDMPDIIILKGQNVRTMAERGFLVNFYDLIDQDPDLSRDDFFTQALSAFEMSGGLYVLPASFNFEYVVINANLPGHFIDEFTQKSFITIDEMMDMYLRLMAAYEHEFGNLQLGIPSRWDFTRYVRSSVDFNLSTLAMESGILFDAIAAEHIDLDAGRADFTNPRFASRLATMMQVFDRDFLAPGGIRLHPHHQFRSPSGTRITIPILDIDDKFVFSVTNGRPPTDIVITPDATYFPILYDQRIPLTDNQGRLLINSNPTFGVGMYMFNPVWAKICISAAADVDLAWEFVKYMLEIYAGRGVIHSSFPIMRRHFEEQALTQIDWALNPQPGDTPATIAGQDDPAQHDLIRETYLQARGAFGEMPMTLLSTMMPRGLYEENLDLFMRGIISTEDFIQQLQNTVALWLIE